MASVFRSQEMCICQIIMPSDSAFKCVAEMGEIEMVHFCDLNTHVNAFDKKFINEIRTCNEIERKLRFIEKELSKNNIIPVQIKEESALFKSEDLLQLEVIVEKMQEELSEVKDSTHSLIKSQCELIELKHVLNTVHSHLDQGLFGAVQQSNADASSESMETDVAPNENQKVEDKTISLSISQSTTGSVRFMAGVITAKKLLAFELTIWRTSRGNAFLRQSSIIQPIEDPVTGQKEVKVVFLIFFQGEKLRLKIEKICQGFQASLYSCPDNAVTIERLIDDVSVRQIDISTVLSSTNEHCRKMLFSAAEQINSYFVQVIKTKAIYNILNMCSTDVAKQSLLAECWIPVQELELIKMSLKTATKESGSDFSAILNRKTTLQNPPTSFKDHKITNAFQSLVDAYGVGDYQEMNPVPFSVISFPFLFALMFGDFGHALIMSLLAMGMCIFERKLSKKGATNEVWQIIFSGRYIILLMGVFSIYTGLIYNDAVSKSIDIFGSEWRVNFDFKHMSEHSILTLEPDPFNRGNKSTWVQMYSGNPYIFGVDPIWALALNKISFLNSMKMKMSIVIGVVQMLLGLSLHLCNILYFHSKKDIFFDFIPKILFFVCMFGYLLLMIFYKWIRYNGSSDQKFGAACAPALLVQYINMFLFTYDSSDCTTATFYPGQRAFQTILVLFAVACIPLMLIPKPVIEIRSHKKLRKSKYSRRGDSLASSLIDLAAVDKTSIHEDSEITVDTETPEKEFNAGDVVMDHTIETIEFFLNSISSAASYLRLWALSLAHAELAEVLWKMLLHLAYVMSETMALKGILIFIIFYAWALLTFGILIVMEGLSAFLHVLRLHWVEFQSKFYKGTGYPFTPLRLKSIADRVNIAG